MAGQTFQVFQSGDGQFAVVNSADLQGVEEAEGSLTVQPLQHEREIVEEQIQPPIPKVCLLFY